MTNDTQLDVSESVHDRFERERKKTKTEHVPPMDPDTFLSSLLDTHEATKSGYYNTESAEESQSMNNNQHDSFDTTWRDRYDTQENRAEIFPAPGKWFLNDVEAAGITWYYNIPKTNDGEPDHQAKNWDTNGTARLHGDFGEPIEEIKLVINGNIAFTTDINNRGEGRHSPWTQIDPVFQAVAEALHQYHIDEDYTAVEAPNLVGKQNTELNDF